MNGKRIKQLRDKFVKQWLKDNPDNINFPSRKEWREYKRKFKENRKDDS